MKYDIFLSYRRDGGFSTAKHLFDLLSKDGYRVSFDIDTLRSGDFDTTLLNRIDQCKDFIIILDAHAFDRTLSQSISPKQDWLRIELAYALKKGKNIIPIFLDGFSFPPINGDKDELPDDIKSIRSKNGPIYNKMYFDTFYKKTKDFLFSKPYKKIRKIYILFFILLAVVAFLFFIYFQPQKNATKPVSPNIRYYIQQDEELQSQIVGVKLHAIVNDTDFFVKLPDEALCFDITDTFDIDGDGTTEALIRNIQACGGNGRADCYFIVKYSKGGYFSISDNMGKNVFESPVFEKWNDKPSFIIIDNFPIHQKDRLRYIYENGNVQLVESSSLTYVTAIKEIKSSEFHDGHERDTITITDDLDNDGLDDTIVCTYWKKWDGLFMEVHFSNGLIDSLIDDSDNVGGYDRIGISSRQTNGVSDLIAGQNIILKWNGKKYEWPPK